MALSRTDILDWAIARGFTPDGEDLVASHRGATVRLRPLKRAIRVTIEKDGHVRRLATVFPGAGHLHIDEHGMLQGAGLGMSFLAACVRTHKDIPSWYPQAYAELARAFL